MNIKLFVILTRIALIRFLMPGQSLFSIQFLPLNILPITLSPGINSAKTFMNKLQLKLI